jgi:type VI secretion system protein ImpB
MSRAGSAAPKERVNIVYKPAIGDAQEEKELPLKLLMLGDYTGRAGDVPLEERRPVAVDKESFDEVLRAHDVRLELELPNRVSGKGGELGVSLTFRALADFGPEAVVQKVPELAKLLEVRQALSALKGPLGNLPAFRKKIQALLKDEGARGAVLAQLAAPKEGES